MFFYKVRSLEILSVIGRKHKQPTEVINSAVTKNWKVVVMVVEVERGLPRLIVIYQKVNE